MFTDWLESPSVLYPLLCVVLLFIVYGILKEVLKSPFSYPYFECTFDVSGKRNPEMEDYIDLYIIKYGIKDILAHEKAILAWKDKCEQKIEKSILRDYRRSQYLQELNDEKAFIFRFTRSQTRYRQQNYVKTAYQTDVLEKTFSCSFDYITDRYDRLYDIGFECTLREYHSKHQRRLVTRDLRESIMIRDNYTCQLCGKFMPDEVGLHIDHIVPVSKGGKSIRSNLRVLCSKCNGAKSNKVPLIYRNTQAQTEDTFESTHDCSNNAKSCSSTHEPD